MLLHPYMYSSFKVQISGRSKQAKFKNHKRDMTYMRLVRESQADIQVLVLVVVELLTEFVRIESGELVN